MSSKRLRTELYRDHVIYWSKDLGRSIDYLETRPDLDPQKIGYYGLSWGAAMGPILHCSGDSPQGRCPPCWGFSFEKLYRKWIRSTLPTGDYSGLDAQWPLRLVLSP